MFLFQVILNVFGSLDLIPLTGVTFPFLSYGGTSMVVSWGLLAFLKAADTRQNASFAIRLEGEKARDRDKAEENDPEEEHRRGRSGGRGDSASAGYAEKGKPRRRSSGGQDEPRRRPSGGQKDITDFDDLEDDI